MDQMPREYKVPCDRLWITKDYKELQIRLDEPENDKIYISIVNSERRIFSGYISFDQLYTFIKKKVKNMS